MDEWPAPLIEGLDPSQMASAGADESRPDRTRIQGVPVAFLAEAPQHREHNENYDGPVEVATTRALDKRDEGECTRDQRESENLSGRLKSPAQDVPIEVALLVIHR